MEIRMATGDFEVKTRELHDLIPTHGRSARLAITHLQTAWNRARFERNDTMTVEALSPSHDALRAVGLL